IAAPVKLPAGDHFDPADGWTVAQQGPVATITPPEANNVIAVVEVGAAANPTEAVAKAWAMARPTMELQPKLVSERPGREGWDARATADYEVPPNAKRAVFAQLFRAGNRWTVALFDMDEGVLEKRGSATRLIVQS